MTTTVRGAIKGQYTTVEKAKADLTLEVGTGVSTLGYNSTNDGGGAEYVVVAGGTGIDDGGSYHDMANGNQLELILTKPANVRQFGAKGDGISIDGARIQAAIDANYGRSLILPSGTYLIDAQIDVVQSIKIYGDTGSVIDIAPTFTSGTAISVQSASVQNRSIKDFVLDGLTFTAASVTPTLWLTNLAGTAITNPEADYVMGSGALASGISGVSLTAVMSGDGVASVTINNGGTGWNGDPVYPYLSNTVRLLFDGDGFGAQATATISGGTLTSVDVVRSGSGYTSPPTVTTAGGYADIAKLTDASVDRRNQNYTNVLTMIRVRGVDGGEITNCQFRDIAGRAIFEQGSRGLRIQNNTFDNCGKEDGAFHVIYTQSFGNVGDSFFSPSEGIIISDNVATNCRRSFAAFMPTGGGVLANNHIDGYREACIFISEKAATTGGQIVIKNNTIVNGTVSDIVCHCVEAGGAKNILIDGNHFENCEEYPIVATGLDNSHIVNNKFINNGSEFVEPYGPFSERYSFNIGQNPTAGRENGLLDRPMIAQIGSLGSRNGLYTSFSNNTVNESRASYPKFIFVQTRTSGVKTSRGGLITSNTISVPSDVKIIDSSVQQVWEYPYFPRFKSNIGHASDAPKIVFKQFAASETGVFTVDVDFMPSSVQIIAASGNAFNGRTGQGWITYDTAGDNDFVQLWSVDTASNAEYMAALSNEIVRTVDAAGAIRFGAEFTAWKETGFSINVITALEITNVRFICHP